MEVRSCHLSTNQLAWIAIAAVSVIAIVIGVSALLLPGRTQLYILTKNLEFGVVRDSAKHSDNSSKPTFPESQHSSKLDDGGGNIYSPTP